jgi:hypothetical protein
VAEDPYGWYKKFGDGFVADDDFHLSILRASPNEKGYERIERKDLTAFAFTDYKCQGRTLQKAIVDLAEGSTSTGMYVMLSRIQQLADLLILRPSMSPFWT